MGNKNYDNTEASPHPFATLGPPKSYSIDFHKNILEVLNSISIKDFSSRAEIDEALSLDIKEFSVRQFLMKNLRTRICLLFLYFLQRMWYRHVLGHSGQKF